MSIVPLNIGSAQNDGSGQDLRSGGQVINSNFSELDHRTTAAQSAAESAQATADAAIPGTQKGQPNGVAGLDGNGTVPASQLPSYVDDVLEFNSFAALPDTGETGKIYITIDTNSQYRWGGTQYVLLTASPGSTDSVPEGSVNKYWTLARTLGGVLTGLVTTNPAVVAATDTVLAAFGKLQRQINDLASSKAGKGSNSDITSLSGLTTPLSVGQGGTGNANGKASDSEKLNGQSADFYTVEMVGASAGAAGSKGLVPAPAAGATRFLSSLGTWLSVSASASWGGIAGTLSSQTDLQTALNAGRSIGVGQTFQNLTASRAIGTVYTNSTGRPIWVSILWGQAAGNNSNLLVNGIRADYGEQSNVGGGGALQAIVPDGATYQVTGSNVLAIWGELR